MSQILQQLSLTKAINLPPRPSASPRPRSVITLSQRPNQNNSNLIKFASRKSSFNFAIDNNPKQKVKKNLNFVQNHLFYRLHFK